MLAVKFVTSVDFISSLIELIAVEKKLPLKLAKKSVHDQTVFDMLIEEYNNDK